METINDIYSVRCTVRKGYRVVIYGYDGIISIDDYRNLDSALFFLGYTLHELRFSKGIPVYKQELYYINDRTVSFLKKVYRF